MGLIRKFTVATAASLLLAIPAFAQAPASDPSDMVRGSPKAPVTVIEYASVGCPHCGVLHREVFPAIKKKYIDTGKVRWVAREMITGDPNMASGGFMIARCAGPKYYFQVTDAIYAQQQTIYNDLVGGLRKIAADAGLNEDQFKTCVTDQKNVDALNERTRLAELDKVNSTPTLLIKGKVVGGGELTLAEFDKIYAAALKPAGKPAAKAPAKSSAKPATKAAPKTPARK